MSHSPSNLNLNDDYLAGWRDLTELIYSGESFSGLEKNCFFLNVGDESFATASAVSAFNYPDDARGLALTDWDGDGDLDLWLANRTAPRVRFLQNTTDPEGGFLSVALQGTRSNRDAIGARLELTAVVDGVEKTWIRTLRAGDAFLSQSSKRIYFATGEAERGDLTIRWPSGAVSTFADLSLGQAIAVKEDGETVTALAPGLPAANVAPEFVANPQDASSHAYIRLTTGVPLPNLTWADYDGAVRQTADQVATGKPWLLNLWASWCGPCREELGAFIREESEIREMGLDIIAVSVDGLGDQAGDPARARRLLRQWKYPYQEGVATLPMVEALQTIQDELFDAKRALPVPTSFLIDGTGKIAAIYRGPVTMEKLRADVASLDLEGEALDDYALPYAGRWLVHSRPGSLFPVAWGLAERGDLELGLNYFIANRDRLSADDEFAKLAYLLGDRASKAGVGEVAISLYAEAVRADPNYAEAFFALGLCLHEAQRYEEARGAYLQAVRKDNTLGRPYFMLALLLDEMDDPQAGTLIPQLLSRAIQIEPDYAPAYAAFAEWLEGAGQPAEAARIRRQAEMHFDGLSE